MSKPINNALSNFDNEVVETAAGKSGFIGNLIGSFKSGGLKGVVSNLTSSVSSFLSDSIQGLNKLASGLATSLLDKLNLTQYLDDFLNFSNKYFSNTMSMLGDIKNDALKQLENAAVNYVSNILEDLMSNLISTIYIPDDVFKLTIEGLYKAGADLAYNNHYLRNQCLARDWNYTLEFVDKEYGITYSPTYSDLDSELAICAKGSCHRNLFYIYGLMYDHYKEIVNDIGSYTSDLEDDISAEKRAVLEKSLADAKRYKSIIEESMVKNLKNLIVNSYTYMKSSDLREFFTEYPEILKPMYFGSTDNKYNRRYMINSNDLNIMMPMHGEHKLTTSDRSTLSSANNHSEHLGAAALEAEKNVISNSRDAINAGLSGSGIASVAKAYVAEKRRELNQTQKDRYGNLTRTALSGGTTAVYVASESRYTMKNTKKNKVKYRDKGIDDVLQAAMIDDKTYVDLRNKHIKSIYALLSSKNVFGSERMINEDFYLRCKIPTATTLATSFDKMRGILGTSMIVQSAFDLSNAIDGSAYNYLKSMEKFLLNPAVNTFYGDTIQGAWELTFQLDPDINELVLDAKEDTDSESTTDKNYANTSKYEDKTNPKDIASNHGSNPSTIEKINNALDSNLIAKQSVTNVLRFASNIPMTLKRDIIIKWVTFFNNAMISKKIDEKVRNKAFSSLIEYVFGKKSVTDSSELIKMFDYSTNESLNNNIKSLVSIISLNKHTDAMKLDKDGWKTTIIDLYNICFNMLSREVQDTGFIKSLFKYDREYLATFFKSSYHNELDFLKSINNRENKMYDIFYPHKDNMTKNIDGFDREGIFGYSDVQKRIQYTNIETGDWPSIAVTSSGTFFGGSDFTKGNGIKRLDAGNGVLIDTNIKDGTWTSIFEYFGTTFFVNSDNELYRWNGSDVITTGIANFDAWEIKTIDSLNLVLLCSKNNNGFKYFTGSTFVSGSTTGSGWKYQVIPSGYVLYPTITAGTPYIITNTKSFKALANSDIYTHFAHVILTETITRNPATTQGSGTTTTPAPTPTVTNEYTLYLFGGTKENGILRYNSKSSSKTVFPFENTVPETGKVTPVGSSKLAIPTTLTDNTIGVIIDNKFITVSYTISKSHTVTGSAPVTSTGEHLVQSGTTTVKTFTKITAYQTCKTKIFYTDTTGSGKQNYYTEIGTSDSVDFDDSIDFNSGILYESYPNDTLYWKRNDGKGIYKFNTTSFLGMLETDDLDLTGWEMIYTGGKLFAINNNVEKGIKILKSNRFENTNITKGFWKVGSSNTKFFAMSYKNTNGGIKYCNKTAANIEFVEIPTDTVKYGDIGGFAFDSSSGIMYFGEDRSDLILDIDTLKFDIDEFIFPLYDYQLQKLLIAICGNKLTIIADNIIGLIESDVALSEIVTLVGSMITSMNSFYNSMVVSSNLYNNLLTYAEAKSEFDIDDPAAMSGIITDFIVNYDYKVKPNDTTATFYGSGINAMGVAGSGPTNSSMQDILARYKADLVTTEIFSNVRVVEVDGEKKTVSLLESLDGDVTEYNKRYNWRSLEFMNSDEDGNIY